MTKRTLKNLLKLILLGAALFISGYLIFTWMAVQGGGG